MSMIKRMMSMMLALVMVMSVIVVAPNEIASALTFEDFMYEVKTDGTVEITNYPNNATGAVVIPSVIDGKSVTSIAAWAFQNCRSITSVTIPVGVTSIGDNVFMDCISLTSVTIPVGITSISNSVFSNCGNLTSVIIPAGVTSIGDMAFEYCRSLTSVTIPSSVTSIGNMAFNSCVSLTSAIIPASVTSIGSMAFSNCSSLISMTIPASVTDIGGMAFQSCSSLTAIDVAADNANYASVDGVLFNKAKTELIQYPAGNTRTTYVIAESVVSIGNMAFNSCQNLTSVTIPSSVTRIGDSAIQSCNSLTAIEVAADNANYISVDGVLFNKAKTQLIQYPAGNTRTTYVIAESVTDIGLNAFSGCKSLTSVTIPSAVTNMGKNTFNGCIKLTAIDVAIDNAKYTSVDGVLFNKAKTDLIQCPAGNTRTTYVIPSSVTSIGNMAFYSCSSLTSVTIPSSVTNVGTSAFRSCSGLTSVTIPSSVRNIGRYVFSNCTKLTAIEVATDNAKYASIDGVLFNKAKTDLIQCSAGNTKETYLIPEGVTSIGEYAFDGCVNLMNVTMPGSMIWVGYSSFENCSSLTSVIIPGSVTSIDDLVFKDSPNLTITCIENSTAHHYAVNNKIKFTFGGSPFIPNDLNGDSIVAILDALIALKCELGIVTRNPLAGNASAKNILDIVIG